MLSHNYEIPQVINECICQVLCLYCKIVLKLKDPTPDFSKGTVPKVQSSEGKCSSRGKFLEAKVLKKLIK